MMRLKGFFDLVPLTIKLTRGDIHTSDLLYQKENKLFFIIYIYIYIYLVDIGIGELTTILIGLTSMWIDKGKQVFTLTGL